MNNPYVLLGPVRILDMFFGRLHELNKMATFLRKSWSIGM
jgi:hypothetical protein